MHHAWLFVKEEASGNNILVLENEIQIYSFKPGVLCKCIRSGKYFKKAIEHWKLVDLLIF